MYTNSSKFKIKNVSTIGVTEVIPEMFTFDGKDKYYVTYGKMARILIKAIKEQQKQIEELKVKVNGQ